MADSGKNAITTNSGDGATTDFSIGFDYLQPEDIEVQVDSAVQVLGTDYDILTDGVTISFTSAPATGTNNVVFTRQSKLSGVSGTPIGTAPNLIYDPSSGSSPPAQALANAFLQCLYYGEEIEDKT